MKAQETVYLDYAATTPLDERVLQLMLPIFRDNFGNPSSVHAYGQAAENALESARDNVASLLNARSQEIVFTSGGSESDNLALRGAALARRAARGDNHILVSPVEHPAVQNTARQLEERFGFEVDLLPVDEYGRVDPRDVESSLRTNTALVSVIYANNEIGTINPIAEIGKVCRAKNVLFHTDAVQAAAHLPIDVVNDQVDLLALGAHKFYGPKGVGVLYHRRGTPLEAIQTGGSHEHSLRAGTQNTAYIAGLAEALRLTREEMAEESSRLEKQRDWLISQVLTCIPRSRLTGHPALRLPNHASFVFEGLDGNTLVMMLNEAGFACSSGSACKVGNPKPSEVLEAIGFSRGWLMGSLRVTLGRGQTEGDLQRFMEVLPDLVVKTRRLS